MADYSTTASVVLTVNGQQAKKMLADLQKQSEELGKKIKAATDAHDDKALKKYKAELRNVNRMMDQIKNSGQKVDAVLQRLDKATPKELNKALVELKRQLNGIERGSDAWNKQIAKIKQVKAQIAELNAEMKVQQSWTQRLASKFNEFGASLMAAVAGLTGLVLAGKKAVSEFAQMDEAMANTQKFTGMTVDQVRDLNEEFKQMDTRTTRDKLNELAQEAGRLGKTSKEDIMGYVQAADILNVALSDLGDGATQKIAKLSNIFGVEETEGTYNAMVKIGSVINVLSQNSTASKPYLVEFTNRLAGVGNQANMTIQQIVGLGAVLDANAQKVEASATAISQVLTRMYTDPSKYARVAGLDVENFANLLKTDANEALLQFLEALNKAGNMDVLAPMFKDMGESGARAIAAMSTLASKIDDVRWQQQNANKAFEEGTSVLHEYEIFNNTAQASIDKARKRIQELSIELGEKLMPIMSHVMSSGTFTLKLLNNLVDFTSKYWRELVTITAAISAYSVVVNLATIKTKAFAGAQAIANGALKAFNLLIKTNPLGLLISALTAAATAFMLFKSKTAEARKEIEASKKTHDEWLKGLTDLTDKMDSNSKHQISVLDRVYSAATNVANSTEKRRLEAQRLIDQYPEYFGKMTTEQIMLGDAKTAYDQLRESILEVAKAKAAEAKIQENQSMAIDIEMENKELEKQRNLQSARVAGAQMAYDTTKRNFDSKHSNYFSRTFGSTAEDRKNLANTKLDLDNANKDLIEIDEKLEQNKEKLKNIESKNEELYNIASKHSNTSVLDQSPIITQVSSEDSNISKDRFAAEKEWREKAEAEARIAYRTGQMDYIQYTQRMDVIAEQFYQKQLEHADLSENERLKIQAAYLDAQTKKQEDWQKATIEAENVSYAFRKSQLIQFYIDGKIEKETYDIQIEELEMEHQRQLIRLTKEGTKERIQAEQQLQNMQFAQVQKRKKEIESLMNQIKDSYFGLNESERQEGYDKEMAALDTVYDKEVAAAQGNAEELTRIEEAKQLAILAIKKKYGKISEDEYKNSFETAIDKSVDWLNSEGGQALTGAMGNVVSGMSAIFSQLSSYIQADLDLQTAAIEKRYDKEVEKAEGNTYRIKKLEKQKEDEIAKVKDEANRKMFAMQVIQAVAQTAQNALNAYGSAAAVPVVGYILAPIAAAMAVAAGAIQVASIKKQQQAAAAQGYAEGGFTPKGGKYEEVGVVHAGEWVASQELVNNPKTRPILEALDYAQRTNTIGSISAKDVSRSITAPMVLAHGGATSQPNVIVNMPDNSSNNELNDTLGKLNRRLDEPFVTVNSVTGDEGYEQAKDKYNRLIKNKSPKSKKPKSSK
ncbi:MAG: phage tail tape measure protein [Muribaculaceae bacterium]|nr:phage tail tape measure protein [Muribaculaceae bacterium]